jgi:2-polyprenyl-6-methoxyphenol hydroxylase-like FAD-dependent oxidoreductase
MRVHRIAVLGGGPAGLYFSYLWKRRHPEDQVDVFERNPEGATFGFGVVFSDKALDFLRVDDPETAEAITARMETWRDITLVHLGERVVIDGVGFSAVGRLEFIKQLTERARSVGVTLRFETAVHSLDELEGYGLIVAADGVNSLVRRTYEGDFKTLLSCDDNKFVWYGTTKRFETLTQTFVETEFGSFNAHHYRYSPTMSTFIVECDRSTWLRAGFAEKTEKETRAICESVFSDTLDGHQLVNNKSIWRNFPWIWNERWSHRNMVLVGDALHTAHFSIGSGTRLALEDVIALTNALDNEPCDLRAALEAYEAARRPVVEKLVKAAKTSASWYQNFPEHMKLAPFDFGYSYITRSGRIDDDQLRAASPRFMERYDAHSSHQNESRSAENSHVG